MLAINQHSDFAAETIKYLDRITDNIAESSKELEPILFDEFNHDIIGMEFTGDSFQVRFNGMAPILIHVGYDQKVDLAIYRVDETSYKFVSSKRIIDDLNFPNLIGTINVMTAETLCRTAMERSTVLRRMDNIPREPISVIDLEQFDALSASRNFMDRYWMELLTSHEDLEPGWHRADASRSVFSAMVHIDSEKGIDVIISADPGTKEKYCLYATTEAANDMISNPVYCVKLEEICRVGLKRHDTPKPFSIDVVSKVVKAVDWHMQ